jgi:hypothetical protein
MADKHQRLLGLAPSSNRPPGNTKLALKTWRMKVSETKSTSPSLRAVRPAHRFISTLFNFPNQITSNISASTSTED